jgi:hypothetical protein
LNAEEYEINEVQNYDPNKNSNISTFDDYNWNNHELWERSSDINHFTDVLHDRKSENRFEVMRKLGESGFGKVFAAKDKLTSELYALKRIEIIY